MAPAAPAPDRLRLRLPLPVPYDLGWVLGFLADRAAPSLERIDAAGMVRAVRIAGVPALLAVRPIPDAAAPRWLAVEAVPAGPSHLPAGRADAGKGQERGPRRLRRRAGESGAAAAGAARTSLRRLVRRMLDLDTDLGPFLALARRDPLLAPLVARHPGLRLPQLPDPFEGAVRAIIGQQVSVAAARTVVDRLIRQLGEPLGELPSQTAAELPGRTPDGPSGAAGGPFFAFPHPAALAAARLERLTALGLTRAKAAALIAVAAATADGTLDWERLRGAPPEAARAALLALPGIGPWTAAYLRMRALGDRDAFPASDLGVIKALAALAPRTPAARIAILAERWRPFRAYAAIHLWRSLSA